MVGKVDPEIFELSSFELAASTFVDPKIIKSINNRELLVEAQGYIKQYRKEFIKANILVNQTEEYSLLSNVQRSKMIAKTVQLAINENNDKESVKYGR
jgi:hypothetical protein